MAQINHVFTTDGAATDAPLPNPPWVPILGGPDRIEYNHLDEAKPDNASSVCFVGRDIAESQAQICELVIGSVWTGGTRQVFWLLRASGADSTLAGICATLAQGSTTVYFLSISGGSINPTPIAEAEFAAAPVTGDRLAIVCDAASSDATFTISRNGTPEDSVEIASPTTGTVVGFGFLGTPTTVSVSEVTLGDADPDGGGGEDETPPTLSNADAEATGSTTAIGSVDTNEAGTAYAVVTTSSTAPSAAQITAGQDHTGASAPAADLDVEASIGTVNFSFSGLDPATEYYLHAIVVDEADNESAVATAGPFETDSVVGTISDTVLLGSEPVEGATVYLINTSNGTLSQTTTDSSGEFSFEDLSLEHEFTIVVQHEEGETQYSAVAVPFLSPTP